MTDKFLYEELLPHEFLARLHDKPIAYLPLGTLEWHGPQNALGSDMIQIQAVFAETARRCGGIVFPPLWLAPDRIEERSDGTTLIGMDTADTTDPHRQLTGSCYWIPKGLFVLMLEAAVRQIVRAGFTCIVADGHGPSRKAWAEMAPVWEKQFGIRLIASLRDFETGEWKTQNDHAGKNETSAMMAIRPELVDLSQLPGDRSVHPLGVHGEDPRDSSASYGRELISDTVAALEKKLAEYGF